MRGDTVGARDARARDTARLAFVLLAPVVFAMALAPAAGAATREGGTIVYDISRLDAELDRTRAEVWAMDVDGSNRRLLATTADNADVEEHGPSMGYISYSEPSVVPNGRDVVFKASAVGHSALECGGFGCTAHFGFNVDGARVWDAGELRDLTPRPKYCVNCSTFYLEPEQINGGRWVGWYEHFQSDGFNFTFTNSWVLGALAGAADLRPGPCPRDVDEGPIAAHPESAQTVAFAACGPDAEGEPWTVSVADSGGSGVRAIASVHVDEGDPAVAWMTDGRRVIARSFDAANPAQAGLYLFDPAAAPGAQRPQLILREPAGVELRSPNAAGGGRIVFSARRGDGGAAPSDVWSIPAGCRGCSFPADATQLTNDGVSADPDWTSVQGLGLPEILSSKARVRGRRVRVEIACPAGGPTCRGKLRVRTTKKVRLGARRQKVVIARGRYRVGTGKSKRIAVKLTGKGRRLAEGRGRIKASIRLRTSTGNTHESRVTLRG